MINNLQHRNIQLISVSFSFITMVKSYTNTANLLTIKIGNIIIFLCGDKKTNNYQDNKSAKFS